MPYKNIQDIKSVNFTQTIPKRCKFKLYEAVETLSGKTGYIVGLQHNTVGGPRGYPTGLCTGNRYYVRFESDGYIRPVNSEHLKPWKDAVVHRPHFVPKKLKEQPKQVAPKFEDYPPTVTEKEETPELFMQFTTLQGDINTNNICVTVNGINYKLVKA